MINNSNSPNIINANNIENKNNNIIYTIQQYQLQSIECYNKEKYVECIKILNKLLEFNQNDIIALCNRATCNYKLELYKHCIKDCDIVLYNEPNNKIALLRKAKSLKQISSTYPNAIEEIKKLELISNLSWGYLSIKLDDEDEEDDYENGLVVSDKIITSPSLKNSNNNENKITTISVSSTTISNSNKCGYSPMISTCDNSNNNINNNNRDSELFTNINEEVSKSPIIIENGASSIVDNCNNNSNQLILSPSNINLLNDEQTNLIIEQLSLNNYNNNNINNLKRKQSEFNYSNDELEMDHQKMNQKITKSNSMEELNKLLEQLSTENIATLISNGNFFVNSGRYEEAIALFTTVIDNNPLIPSAYLGRGTSNAFLGDLDEAIYDFSKAIELDNTSSDAYKRRGQSKVAKGMEYEALEDFNQSVAFDKESDYDIYYNRGLLHYQMRNYERALKDFKKVVSIETGHKLAWNRIGLCLNVNGYPMEAYNAFLQSINLDPQFEASYTNIGQCWRDLGKFKESLESFSKALEICPNYSNALHLRGLLYYNSGKHLDAIKDWSMFLQDQCSKEKEQIESLQQIDPAINDVRQFRAITYHSMGRFRKSLMDYDEILQRSPLHYVFYQKEIALFTHHHLDQPLSTFNIDRSLNPYLKTFQCQRIPHTSLVSYKLQDPINDIIPDIELTPSDNNIISNDILLLSKELGEMLQYNCEGFLPNSRQKLQCGFAIIEIAQTLREFWKNKTKYGMIELDGKSSSKSIFNSNTGVFEDMKHKFGWRDLYDIGVKWRQISEPNDPVYWVDLLSQEQFNEGFGSHTPIITGQCKVVRYYPQFEKSFEIMKLLIPIQHQNYLEESETFLNDLDSVQTCKELHKLMKKDFYVVTPCYSLIDDQKVMEGTRLTLQYVHPEGYEFAIRTPGTPLRWKQYDEEMTSVWNKLVEKSIQYHDIQDQINHEYANHGQKNQLLLESQLMLLDELSDLILTLTFYWYNFMPLSRGSAALGFTTLLGLFLSLDIQITSPIPKNQQPDWDAILKPTPQSFINSIKPWLYPSRSKFLSTNLIYNNNNNFISNNINTIRKMIQVLNLSLKY